MIKAVLAHNEVSYERTHNIAYLLTLLDEASIPKPDGQKLNWSAFTMSNPAPIAQLDRATPS